jgi:hypothetical protein
LGTKNKSCALATIASLIKLEDEERDGVCVCVCVSICVCVLAAVVMVAGVGEEAKGREAMQGRWK